MARTNTFKKIRTAACGARRHCRGGYVRRGQGDCPCNRFPLFAEPDNKADHAAGQVKVLEAIPDFNEEVLQQFGEGDLVFSRLRLRGTRKGEFMGVPAANQKIDIEIFNVMQMHDAKIVEEWDEFDTITFLVQLGVIGQPQIGAAGS